MPDHAIATPHADATLAGVRAFEAGGSVVDAALAAAAMLTVAYPHNCALGGDLFALVRRADGSVLSVNASGPAGRFADAERLRALGPTMPITGPETVTVPGLVAGWERLHELGGRLPWADALAPAAAAAQDGVAVASSLAAAIAEDELADPGLAGVFAPHGRRLQAGDVLRQPALAQTLRELAADGPRVFYEGDVAARLITGLAARGGHLVAADLHGFAAGVDAPLRRAWRDLEVLTSGPNSSGILALQALAALDAARLADPLGRDAGALAEILRAGSADRDRLLGDPRAVDVDPDSWLGEARIDAIVRGALRAAVGERPAGVADTGRPGGDTVAVVTADADGNAVSLIQSLFHSFGSGILEPDTGVLLHNRGSFFALEEGHPNALAPGRRPAHTLMPLMVERGGRLLGVLGTMGGKAHAQILVQVLLGLLADAPPQQAVDLPRWIAGGMEMGEPDDTLRIEDGCAGAARAALGRARLRLVDVPRGSEALGHAQAIWCSPALAAGSDSRADGSAATVTRRA
jgi:gamma-glutamyltranspeptidase